MIKFAKVNPEKFNEFLDELRAKKIAENSLL
jgi:hypothetical protein